MKLEVTRRTLVLTGVLSAAGFVVSRALGGSLMPQTSTQMKKKDPLAADLVKEFVGAGHGDLDKVKRMLAQTPGLLNATWDWGDGDFESAIGGAGHMGRPDIAEYLISQGARYDIFVAAMLGETETIKRVLETHPNLKDSKGPHGITLIRHAQAGGERAKATLEFLESIRAS